MCNLLSSRFSSKKHYTVKWNAQWTWNWYASFISFASLVSMVCPTRFVWSRSFSFSENTPWCLKCSLWVTLFLSLALPCTLPSYSPVRCSGNEPKATKSFGIWTLSLCHLASPMWWCRPISQQHPSCCWELFLSLGFSHLKIVLTTSTGSTYPTTESCLMTTG